MKIKVLHIFAPGYKSRFGGATYMWRYYFSNWNRSEVKHYVLDTDTHQVLDAKAAFCFEYSTTQKKTTRWQRFVWIFKLLASLLYYGNKYTVLHVHVLWWGSLLLGPLAKWMHIPTLYESVLFSEDTPSGIEKERFGELQISCLRSYRAILAISDALAADYLEFGFSEEQVYTLMNCVDTKLFLPSDSKQKQRSIRRRLDLPEDGILLLFTGSVIERKGVDVLIHAFVEASLMNPQLRLLIAGPRNKSENPSLDENFVGSLQTELDRNNLGGRVRFLGLIQDRQKIAELYRAADIFVFPSRNEGLPSVVLEAMSSGLPVIVSRLPGIAKVIRHGESGVLVPIDDVSALREAILMLSTNHPLAGRIGSNARGYIMQHHGFSHWQTHLITLYEQLLSYSNPG